jgi:hypothetical protein
MHKTFYVDVDEEVTSIIDRLKKSSVKENILVIPQRALILQSIVNLKLLKRESEKNKKQIMIITQDTHGQALVEKAGILVQSSMEGIEEEETVREDFHPKINDSKIKERLVENMEKKEKLKNLGTNEFFDISPRKIKKESRAEKNIFNDQERIQTVASEIKYGSSNLNSFDRESESRESVSEKLDPKKERDLEKLFGKAVREKKEIMPVEKRVYSDENREQKQGAYNQKVSNRVKKVFSFFGIICLLSIISVGMYLFFPQTEIEIYPQTKVEKSDIEVIGTSEGGSDGMSIISRGIEEESSVTFSFEATGKKNVSDQKSHGKVTIYNEYSAASQQLVATTRLLTKDGKMFRLVEGVVVPGVSVIDGKNEPGIIEVEVVSDQAGDEYNIEADSFSIPGLKGSPKYEKIYARSATSMVGGGSDGLEMKSVSEEDVKMAKIKTEESARNEVLEKIKGKLEEGEIVVDSSISEEIVNSSTSLASGMVAENFNYQVNIKTKAIIVSQKQIDELVKNYFSKKNEDNMVIAQIKIEQGNTDVDFEKNSLVMRLHAEVLFRSDIDLEKIKSEVLGKNRSQLKGMIENNETIKKVELSFHPDFLGGRIPSQGKWVNLKLVEPVLE